MLTVAVLLSGPHRLEMLDTALSSIPIDSPTVSAVHIMHQNGKWDWGGALRERMEAHPKVRIIEFPSKVDFASSFNRTLDTVQSPWGLILPDDDYLLASSAESAFKAVAADPNSLEYGFAAFGWYYLKDERFLASYLKRRGGLHATLYFAPKFCTTMLNMKRVRELGGFNGTVGGFCDTVLFGQLSYEFNALVAATPIGIYRMHEGQESQRMQKVYAPYVDQLSKLLGGYARDAKERKTFERELFEFANGEGRIGGAQAVIADLTFRLRSRAQPVNAPSRVDLLRWSRR
jgi:hypothetical protein